MQKTRAQAIAEARRKAREQNATKDTRVIVEYGHRGSRVHAYMIPTPRGMTPFHRIEVR